MPSDRSLEARTDGFAVPDTGGHFYIKLGNVVPGIRGDPFRYPAVVGWDRELGQFPGISSGPFHVQLLSLHRSPRSCRELDVALFTVDLEQEGGSAVHAAADLEGYDSTGSGNAVDDELVGHGLQNQLAGFLERYAVTLAHDERGDLAKFTQATAEGIDLVTAGDRHQVGAVCEVGLVGAVDGRSPIRGAADHRCRQNAADIAVGDQVLGVIDCRRYLALQSDRMADVFSLRCIAQPDRLVGVAAKRPLAIDMLSRFDRGHDRQVM